MTDIPDIDDGPQIEDGSEIEDGLAIEDSPVEDGQATEDGQEIAIDVDTPALSRDLTEFLIQLSITVHRFGMYPPGHPSLEPAAAGVVDRLPGLMEDRESLAIGVASGQLIIEGIATDAGHPVLSDLSRRLHGHQLGALSMDRGLTVSEVQEVCRILAADAERAADPIGLLPRDEVPDWDHIHFYPLGYDRLVLKDSGAGMEGVSVDRATELWLGLARSAMAGREDDGDEAPTPRAIADSMRSHRKEEAYDQMIVGHLLQLAEELKGGQGEAAQIREQVSDLIEELDESTLQRFVDMGGDFSQRRRFVLAASQGLAADAVMKVLQAAAANSQQTISHSMTRLLTKLAVHSDGGDPAIKSGAEDALQENVEELMAEWQLTDPNPDAYTFVLDKMSRAAPVLAGDFEDVDEGAEPITGAARFVEMALEVDAFGPTVERAVIELLEEGRARFLIDVAREASGSQTAKRIMDQLANPDQLRRLLATDEVDVPSMHTIVAGMGSVAIDPLLDALADSESKELRQVLLETLSQFGSEIWDGARVRLEDPQWRVTRNMLLLIQTLDELPEDFNVTEWLGHADRRVRREAFPLAIRGGHREKTLANAMADEDERMVRMGLLELGDSVPETLVPIVVNRVVLGDRSAEIRAFGIRAAGQTRSPLVLETLLTMTSTGKTIFRRPILAPKSMEVLAALGTLAQFWPDEARVSKILKVAKRSKDPEIRAAGDAL